MGISHVYFPTIEKWRAINPELTAAHYDAVPGTSAPATREGVPLRSKRGLGRDRRKLSLRPFGDGLQQA
jgi:hypothetical protein